MENKINYKLLAFSSTIGVYTLFQKFNPNCHRQTYKQLKQICGLTFISSFIL